MALQKRQHFLLLQRCIKKIEPPTVAGNRGQFKFSSFKDFLYCFLCYISLRVIFSYFGKMLDVNRYFNSQNVRPTLENVYPAKLQQRFFINTYHFTEIFIQTRSHVKSQIVQVRPTPYYPFVH